MGALFSDSTAPMSIFIGVAIILFDSFYSSHRFIDSFVGISPEGGKLDYCPSFNSSLHDRVYYGSGGMLIMNGNTLHRGCEYKQQNFRLFFTDTHKDYPLSKKRDVDLDFTLLVDVKQGLEKKKEVYLSMIL
jgi:hypothetical protein